jgi:hypothetical protein
MAKGIANRPFGSTFASIFNGLPIHFGSRHVIQPTLPAFRTMAPQLEELTALVIVDSFLDLSKDTLNEVRAFLAHYQIKCTLDVQIGRSLLKAEYALPTSGHYNYVLLITAGNQLMRKYCEVWSDIAWTSHKKDLCCKALDHAAKTLPKLGDKGGVVFVGEYGDWPYGNNVACQCTDCWSRCEGCEGRRYNSHMKDCYGHCVKIGLPAVWLKLNCPSVSSVQRMEREAFHPRELLGYHPEWKFKDDRHLSDRDAHTVLALKRLLYLLIVHSRPLEALESLEILALENVL